MLAIKNFLSSSEIAAISDGKEFSFNWSNIGSMINSFDDRSVLDMDICNKYSNIILDFSIRDDKNMQMV